MLPRHYMLWDVRCGQVIQVEPIAQQSTIPKSYSFADACIQDISRTRHRNDIEKINPVVEVHVFLEAEHLANAITKGCGSSVARDRRKELLRSSHKLCRGS
jgi:hypothetical protein